MNAGISWLDVKLGARMLVKHPGLALVGGLGMAVAITIGALAFEVISTLTDPALPVEEGERVVALENWDLETNNQERQILHDFGMWREELESVEELAAWMWPVERNLVTSEGPAGPVEVARVTASSFRLMRTSALLGRTLVEADERAGAPRAVVIGYDAWHGRFAGDPNVVGATVRLGGVEHTVVGVMPEGFGFPIDEDYWTALRPDPSEYERLEGPGIYVAGRLAPGFTLEEARAELATIGRGAAAAFPETHERLRPRMMPYTVQFLDDWEPGMFAVLQSMVTMLLVIVCVNIAVLVYARTATRHGEIAVRSALGASRGRVVGQLFMEGFVLSGAAAVIGIVVAGAVLGWLVSFVERLVFLPFWMDFGLSLGTILYVAGLAVLGAILIGVVPALKATGKRVRIGLQRLGSGGAGLRMGKTWTALIVTQVAFAVAILPPGIAFAWEFVRNGFADPGFAAEEYLSARLELDPKAAQSDESAFAARFATNLPELVRRIEAEPEVSDVTYAMNLPGQERRVWVEVEGVPTPEAENPEAIRTGTGGHQVRLGRVALDYFDAFDVPMLTGRRFDSRDLGGAATAVIVNRSFVREVLSGGNALGRRVRAVGRGGDVSPGDVELGRWYQIVGVVPDFPNALESHRTQAKLYHPLAPGEVYPVDLSVRMRGATPASFTGPLREISRSVDPALRLDAIMPLDVAWGEQQGAMRLAALGIALVTLSVLLLSAAGLHALMSFAVTLRRREIGIRAALGAGKRRILGTVFSRALGQLALGIAAGIAVAGWLDWATEGELTLGAGPILLAGVAAFMLAVGVLSAWGPARRGLQVEPTEALKADG